LKNEGGSSILVGKYLPYFKQPARKEPPMASVAQRTGKGKKKKVLREGRIVSADEYDGLQLDAKAELIRQLVPLGLRFVSELLQEEVTNLAGERYSRTDGRKDIVRHGTNPGSVKLAGQRHAIRVPRVRDRQANAEVPLESLEAVSGTGNADEKLLLRVLRGMSCRDYEACAEAIPGAIGLSPSTVSRQFIEASTEKLRELQERDLSSFDFVTLFLDGKAFADDVMVTALGVAIDGRKVILGFVQAGTENEPVLTNFLRELVDRGLRADEGLLVVLDGGKGLRAAVKKVFKKKAAVQRCQWHKRENIVSYLPKADQPAWRRRLQRAYSRPTYAEAKAALLRIRDDLHEMNLDAAKSLEEGFEETLTLHRLGLYPVLGRSLKTTNCIESIFGQVEDRCGKVSNWKNSSQKQRWLASSLLDIEPRLRRIQGYKHLGQLREALQRTLELVTGQEVA
jgi:transposase-like protein